jgi:GTP diphosphokinase / guanosine-3',5'-bis(diphosphate) 3'-diphosphatase
MNAAPVISTLSAEEERLAIIKDYRHLIRIIKPRMQPGDMERVRRAFEIAVEAHKNMRRKSGEPYIHHPIAVARIVADELGLGITSVICALLHDTVEDTEVTIEDIRKEFGESAARIIEGLTKIGKISSNSESIQAENYRKILLTLSDDIRVILVKIADRLHNMRTMDTMSRKNQLKISSETLYLYAPLAHRMGLYNVKGELEDLSMKYTEIDTYKSIARKLEQTKKERTRFINDFCKPLSEELDKAGVKGKVFGRPKTIFSIWNKMKKKGVEFEDIYDRFAIRIILESPPEREKEDCWRAYSIVTDLYKPNPNRLRDWISHPKANGYESLHTTVMGPKGRWVEVQIRSERMDEVAERGLAAHWKYKENKSNTQKLTADEAIESWLVQVREFLKNPEVNPIEFINDFKLQLFAREIYVFTPKGDTKIIPVGATALDFAYTVHTDVGDHCLGAKVNGRLVSISHPLSNGDQIEIITSKKQKPSEDWINFVITSRAKSKIKAALKEEKKKQAEDGKDILERKLRQLKVNFNAENIQLLTGFFKMPTTLDMYFNIANEKLDLNKIKSLSVVGGYLELPKSRKVIIKKETGEEPYEPKIGKNAELIIFGESSDKIPYEFAKCCNPIPGDDVLGFVAIQGVIKIHRTNCVNAQDLMSKYGYRIVKTRWTSGKSPAFLTGIELNGLDDLGLINKLTTVISSELKINMQSMSIESNDGIFEGTIKVYVNSQEQLNDLLARLKTLDGIISVNRTEHA